MIKQDNFSQVLSELSYTKRYILSKIAPNYLKGINWAFFSQNELNNNPEFDLVELQRLIDTREVFLCTVSAVNGVDPDEENLIIQLNRDDYLNSLIYARCLDKGIEQVPGFEVQVVGSNVEYDWKNNPSSVESKEYKRLLQGLKTRFIYNKDREKFSKIGLYMQNASHFAKANLVTGETISVNGYQQKIDMFVLGMLEVAKDLRMETGEDKHYLKIINPSTSKEYVLDFNTVLYNQKPYLLESSTIEEISGYADFLNRSQKAGVWFYASLE